MQTSLKNVTERAQKCDFSVNFHILIQQTGFRSHFVSESWHYLLLCFST